MKRRRRRPPPAARYWRYLWPRRLVSWRTTGPLAPGRDAELLMERNVFEVLQRETARHLVDGILFVNPLLGTIEFVPDLLAPVHPRLCRDDRIRPCAKL